MKEHSQLFLCLLKQDQRQAISDQATVYSLIKKALGREQKEAITACLWSLLQAQLLKHSRNQLNMYAERPGLSQKRLVHFSQLEEMLRTEIL